MELNEITRVVIDAAMGVHKELGPGLLESAYESCLAYELVCRGVQIQRQLAVPVKYRDVVLDIGYRIDLLVEDEIIVEIKSVQTIAPIHLAQVLSYLRLRDSQIGLLLNFNTINLRNGIRRVVNDFYR